jgi:hypothetical protein
MTWHIDKAGNRGSQHLDAKLVHRNGDTINPEGLRAAQGLDRPRVCGVYFVVNKVELSGENLRCW